MSSVSRPCKRMTQFMFLILTEKMLLAFVGNAINHVTNNISQTHYFQNIRISGSSSMGQESNPMIKIWLWKRWWTHQSALALWEPWQDTSTSYAAAQVGLAQISKRAQCGNSIRNCSDTRIHSKGCVWNHTSWAWSSRSPARMTCWLRVTTQYSENQCSI